MQEISVNPKLEPSWLEVLKPEFEKEYFKSLKEFLLAERAANVVFPKAQNIFKAYDTTPFNQVKVVILGQDPYHGEGQAQGLSFSVPEGMQLPPSLKNIYKELQSDLGVPVSKSGDLMHWAEQGVMLLNATLTVRKSTPGSHQKKGWEQFTDETIKLLSEKRESIVFLLWGNYARAKKSLIDTDKHLVLEAAHPSPFSAHNGFFGCKHFSKTNAYLLDHHLAPINWGKD